MRMTHGTTLFVLGALVIASAAEAQQRAMRSGIRITKESTVYPDPPPPPVLRGTVEDVRVPGTNTTVLEPWNVTFPQYDPSAYLDTREASLAAHMLSVDSLQSALGEIGKAKLRNTSARDFASQIMPDYVGNYDKLVEIITDEGVGSAPLARDVELDRLRVAIGKFQMMPPGDAFDAAFMRFQIDHHQNELDLLTRNRGNVHDNDFERFLDGWTSQLKRRVDQAVRIASSQP